MNIFRKFFLKFLLVHTDYSIPKSQKWPHVFTTTCTCSLSLWTAWMVIRGTISAPTMTDTQKDLDASRAALLRRPPENSTLWTLLCKWASRLSETDFLSLQGGNTELQAFVKKKNFGTNSSKYLVVHTNNTSRLGICVWAGKPRWQQYQLQGCGPSRRDWSRGTLKKNVVRIISTF